MTGRRIAWWAWICLLPLLVACPGGGLSDSPPEMLYGLDECGYCRMIVSEERFSAAVVADSGEVVRFDDLGCLLSHLREHPEPAAATWVHDYQSADWVSAKSAFFVRSQKVTTPMGSGWVAFSSRQAASTLGRDGREAARSWRGFLAGEANEPGPMLPKDRARPPKSEAASSSREASSASP